MSCRSRRRKSSTGSRRPADAEVAAFVGDAVLLPGRLCDRQADSVLGALRVRNAEGVRRARPLDTLELPRSRF